MQEAFLAKMDMSIGSATRFREDLTLNPCNLDSGYSSAANTPDAEPFLDFETLEMELNCLMSSPDLHEDSDEGSQSFPALEVSTEQQNFLVGNFCRFYVKGLQGSRSFFSLHVAICAPNGNKEKILQFTQLSDRVACVFRPLLPGLYKITAKASKHKEGNLQLPISRDYVRDPKPIVKLDIELPSDDQPGIARKPWGIACNPYTEEIWVADRQRHEILVYKPDGELHFQFGRQGSGPGEFFRPTGLAFDLARNRVLVTDKDNHRIQIFTDRGEYLGEFGSKGCQPGQFYHPWGVAVSPGGSHIAITDTRNHRIQLFNGNGVFLRQFRLRGQRKDFKKIFDYPRGIAFSLDGREIFVTDFNLHTVFSLDIGLQHLRPLTPQGLLFRPSGISVDAAGNLLVCDNRHHLLHVFHPNGHLIRSISALGSQSLVHPLDITVLPKAGFIAIIDLNGRVQII